MFKKTTSSIKLNPIIPPDTVPDITRIVAACAKAGYQVSEADAWIIWRCYSDYMAAEWVSTDTSDAAIVGVVLEYSKIAP